MAPRDADREALALGGFMSVCGDPDRPPTRVGQPQATVFSSINAYTGAMLAYYHRLRGGEGQHIDASMQEGATLITDWSQEQVDYACGLVAQFLAGFTKKELYEEAIRRRQMLYPVQTVQDAREDRQLIYKDGECDSHMAIAYTNFNVGKNWDFPRRISTASPWPEWCSR